MDGYLIIYDIVAARWRQINLTRWSRPGNSQTTVCVYIFLFRCASLLRRLAWTVLWRSQPKDFSLSPGVEPGLLIYTARLTRTITKSAQRLFTWTHFLCRINFTFTVILLPLWKLCRSRSLRISANQYLSCFGDTFNTTVNQLWDKYMNTHFQPNLCCLGGWYENKI